MAFMEAKMEQKLVGIVHTALFQVFIDTHKVYDSLDIGRCMEIICGYGLGPTMKQLLQRYWDGQKVVLKAGKCFGSLFNTKRGVTQRDPVSSTIFNIVVYAVVRAALLEVYGLNEAHHRFGWVAEEQNFAFRQRTVV